LGVRGGRITLRGAASGLERDGDGAASGAGADGTAPVSTAFNGKHTWANVYIDSVKVGGTPLHRKIKAGYHVVEVRRGSVRKRRRVLIRAGRKTNITFKLR
jgi:hypothetical protein